MSVEQMTENSREKFISDSFGDSMGVFMDSPIIMIFAGGETEQSKKISDLIYKKITNEIAVKIIVNEEDVLNIKEVSGELTKSGLSINELRIIVVLESETFDSETSGRIYAQAENQTNALSISTICIVNETSGSKDRVREMLDFIARRQDKEPIFILGETKFGGKNVNENELLRDRTEICAELTVNAGSVFKDTGVYSAGISFFDDYIRVIWMKYLEKANAEHTANMSEYNAAGYDNFINTIDALLKQNGYKNNMTPEIFDNVIFNKNDGDGFISLGIEDLSRKMYGDALEVYLANEKRKANEILENLNSSFEETTMTFFSFFGGYMSMIDGIVSELRTKADEFYAPKQNEDDNMYIFETNDNDIKTRIYNRYLYPKITEIKNMFFSQGIKNVCTIIEKCRTERESNLKTVKEITQKINNMSVNFINSHTSTDYKPDVNMKIFETSRLNTENYDEILCREVNRFMTENRIIENITVNMPEEIMNWLRNEAELYCKNQKWSVKDENYYILADLNGFIGKIQLGSNEKIGRRNEKNVTVLKLSQISLEDFIRLSE